MRTRTRLRAQGSGRRLALLALVPLALAGCRQDMHDNPRHEPLEASRSFADQSSSRMLIEGTVPRGQLKDDDVLYTGMFDGMPTSEFPFAITRTELDRGENRYNVFCAPCHGQTGEGRGMVVQRGYRQPPSFHIDRLRDVPPGYMFDVITNGFGVMPDYRTQVKAEDRWAIVAYIKALQLSQNATEADVPESERGKLNAPSTQHAAPGTPGTQGSGGH